MNRSDQFDDSRLPDGTDRLRQFQNELADVDEVIRRSRRQRGDVQRRGVKWRSMGEVIRERQPRVLAGVARAIGADWR